MNQRSGRTIKAAVYLMGFAVLFGGATLAYGFSSYLNQFNTTYGTSGTSLNSCGVCHVNPGGGGTLTGYGADFNGDFVAIENLDSDRDSFSNIIEIRARTNPGDAASRPAAADTAPPTVTAFTMPATGTSLTVSVTAFTATDNVGVTGYRITETAAAPAATTTGWTASRPTSYAFSTAGTKTVYAWAKDAAGNVSASRNASIVVTLPDAIAPAVTQLVVPATAGTLTVPISTLTASDNVGVTGYYVAETATRPLAGGAGWSTSAPRAFTFASAGAKTLYAWAKDAAGNISASASANVTITLSDTNAPTITGLVIPASAGSLTVPITSFTASDNVGVTGYFVKETATAPLPSASGWLSAPPAAYTFASGGAKTLYGWAKDAAGNVSAAASATVTITTADSAPPVVTNFVIPIASSSLTVPVTTFTASDNVGVTGYRLTETATAPLASASGWSATRPTGYNFASAGVKMLYAWAKDAAGNVSPSLNASVTISLADSIAPVVTSFVIPATSSSLTVQVSNLTATDNVGVSGYFLTETTAPPSATATGWRTTTPASHTFASGGSKTLYVWAKDAAGNVSTGTAASVTITLPAPPPSSSSITAGPTSLYFSEVEVSESQTKTVRISNAGKTAVIITGVRIDKDAFRASFRRPVRVPANRYVTLRVTFSPEDAGTESGELRIFVGDQDTPAAVVSLHGTGEGDEGESDYGDRRDDDRRERREDD